MILIEETTVPQSALPVAAFREHLLLGTGFAGGDLQDPVLERFLRAAMAAIEARTGKILIERLFAWTLNYWTGRSSQLLPVAPVSAVTGLVLIDRTGAETSIDISRVRLMPDAQRPELVSTSGGLPNIPVGGSVRIGFQAGYGADWDALPSELGQATMLLAAYYYEYRHEAAHGGSSMPYGVSALIERHRSLRLTQRGRG